MDLPPHVAEILGHARVAIDEHPAHHLHWTRRKAIYEALGVGTTQVGTLTYVWLGVLSAERVLPIYRAVQLAEPIRPDSEHLVHLARMVAEGSLKPDDYEVDDSSDYAYHLYGHFWSRTGIPYGVEMVALATWHALNAARGELPFYLDDSILNELWNENVALSEEDIAKAGAPDVASPAVIAFAYNARMERQDPVQEYAFWQWWLEEAIPLAWRKAVLNRPKARLELTDLWNS